MHAHIDTLLARLALKAEKRAGRVRNIGVQVIGDTVYPQLEGSCAVRNVLLA